MGKAVTFIHLPLKVPMEMGASSYWISAEERIPFRGREVLCIIRDTDCITSCCGESAGLRSVAVPGYIVDWHSSSCDGRPVSTLEAVADETERKEVSRLVRQTYHVAQVEFS
jgi:hypothetical protein